MASECEMKLFNASDNLMLKIVIQRKCLNVHRSPNDSIPMHQNKTENFINLLLTFPSTILFLSICINHFGMPIATENGAADRKKSFRIQKNAKNLFLSRFMRQLIHIQNTHRQFTCCDILSNQYHPTVIFVFQRVEGCNTFEEFFEIWEFGHYSKSLH